MKAFGGAGGTFSRKGSSHPHTMIKFLHIADTHIDSPFSALDTAGKEAMRTALLTAFRRATDIIREEEIHLCFVAGDLFDTAYPSEGAVAAVKAAIASCPECIFFVTPGNHDPYTPDSVWARTDFGENVTVFSSSSPMCVDIPDYNMTVYGYAFTDKEMESFPAADLRADPDRINILVAHADTCTAKGTDAPVTESTLSALGMDYIALGHIHNPPAPKKAGKTAFAYTGCTVGRDFGECGDKGVYVGGIEKGRVELSFRTVSDSRFLRESVDVTGAENDGDIAGRIAEHVSARGITPRDKVRMTLTGALPAGVLPTMPAIKAMIPPTALWQIKDETAPAIDSDELRRDITLRGEFYRKLLPMLESEKEEERKTAEQALKLGLCAINGVNIDEV